MKNLITLKQIMAVAEKNGYAVGSYSPRYTPMIRPILQAGQQAHSPLIVQISQNELNWYELDADEFATEFHEQMRDLAISVPVALHLDHTRDFEVIERAISAGFTSVMIDMSAKPLAENIAITREVVEYAHAKGVSVEAELGRIGTTDFVETDEDVELYTDPDEAKLFVQQTGIDALAVSVGTAHGVYKVRQPKVDLQRLRAIRANTDVHLVLHGGSGVPPHMIQDAIRLEDGGISKVNIATDLEQALLATLGREERMTNAECKALSADEIDKAREAVRATVIEKMEKFVLSANHADDYLLSEEV